MRWLRRAAVIGKRTLVSFYDDQMTQHAGALTYYSERFRSDIIRRSSIPHRSTVRRHRRDSRGNLAAAA
jgi:hypothetical protein